MTVHKSEVDPPSYLNIIIVAFMWFGALDGRMIWAYVQIYSNVSYLCHQLDLCHPLFPVFPLVLAYPELRTHLNTFESKYLLNLGDFMKKNILYNVQYLILTHLVV